MRDSRPYVVKFLPKDWDGRRAYYIIDRDTGERVSGPYDSYRVAAVDAQVANSSYQTG